MIGAKNFQLGANAIRESLARMYARAPGSLFEGLDVAKFIMAYPAPTFRTEESTVDVKDLAG